MNIKFILKTLFFVAVATLLVIMGLHNGQSATLSMPGILRRDLSCSCPAALMYIIFFGVGFLAGAVLMSGGKRGGGSGRSNKVQT